MEKKTDKPAKKPDGGAKKEVQEEPQPPEAAPAEATPQAGGVKMSKGVPPSTMPPSPPATLPPNPEWSWSVAVSPDGRYLLTTGAAPNSGPPNAANPAFAMRIWRMPAPGQGLPVPGQGSPSPRTVWDEMQTPIQGATW
jgi:hypothetical protein